MLFHAVRSPLLLGRAAGLLSSPASVIAAAARESSRLYARVGVAAGCDCGSVLG